MERKCCGEHHPCLTLSPPPASAPHSLSNWLATAWFCFNTAHASTVNCAHQPPRIPTYRRSAKSTIFSFNLFGRFLFHYVNTFLSFICLARRFVFSSAPGVEEPRNEEQHKIAESEVKRKGKAKQRKKRKERRERRERRERKKKKKKKEEEESEKNVLASARARTAVVAASKRATLQKR